jgi:hypothetical protein
VSGVWRIVLTEIFAIRIKRGNLGTHRYLAKRANGCCTAIARWTGWKEWWTQDAQLFYSQPSFSLLSLPSLAFLLPPQGRGCGESIRLSRCSGGAGNVARVVDATTKAIRASQGAEVYHSVVGDAVSMMFSFFLCPAVDRDKECRRQCYRGKPGEHLFHNCFLPFRWAALIPPFWVHSARERLKTHVIPM